ncbi:hypothetical protein [Pseudomonas sp. RL_15y_Pfl2_60]|uniref:hypothetical protein n=1 Tax=Pseudomonas sp. RL_15y_Pfl2_60 TaxID=3088709 RepID=UPI0030DA4590
MLYFSKATGGFYDGAVHASMPSDVVEVSRKSHEALMAGQSAGQVITGDDSGNPILTAPVPIVLTTPELCKNIDAAADATRLAIIGDPLRATEYERAAIEAQDFKDAGYPDESVPRTVSAWAINGRTAQQAADSILAKSAAFDEALYSLRETRLSGKEQVRAAMAAGDYELANDIAASTVTALESIIKNTGDNSI